MWRNYIDGAISRTPLIDPTPQVVRCPSIKAIIVSMSGRVSVRCPATHDVMREGGAKCGDD